MAKISGLSEKFYLVQTGANGVGIDCSGDIGSIDSASLTMADIDATGIDKTYHERLPGLVDAQLGYTAHFNPATGASFPLERVLMGADGAAIWIAGSAIGSAAYAIQGLNDTLPVARSGAGQLTVKPRFLSDAGVAGWGFVLLNNTDTTGATHTAVDDGASSAFGAGLFVILLGLTGTNVTVTVEDSSDNVTFAAVTGLTVTFTGSTTGYAYVETSGTATINRYVHVVTSGTFTSAQAVAVLLRN